MSKNGGQPLLAPKQPVASRSCRRSCCILHLLGQGPAADWPCMQEARIAPTAHRNPLPLQCSISPLTVVYIISVLLADCWPSPA